MDVYIDIASSKAGSSRKEFSRMLQDCKSRDIEIILTKSSSRFGRDTVEIFDALNQLRLLGVRVIFEQEVLDIANTDNDLMFLIIESIAQAKNESRSDIDSDFFNQPVDNSLYWVMAVSCSRRKSPISAIRLLTSSRLIFSV